MTAAALAAVPAAPPIPPKPAADLPSEVLEARGMAMMLFCTFQGREGLLFAAEFPETYLPAVWTNGAMGYKGRTELLNICRGVQRPSWTADDSRLFAHSEWWELPDEMVGRLLRLVPRAACRALELLDEIDGRRAAAKLQAVSA